MPNHKMQTQAKYSVEFSVSGTPRTKGSFRSFVNPKTNKVVTLHDNKLLKGWQQAVAFEARRAGCPLSCGAVSLEINYVLPRPKQRAPEFPITRPDVDKMERAIMDALTGVAYHDDGQVIQVSHGKVYTSPTDQYPGARIRVNYLPEPPIQLEIPIKGVSDDF